MTEVISDKCFDCNEKITGYSLNDFNDKWNLHYQTKHSRSFDILHPVTQEIVAKKAKVTIVVNDLNSDGKVDKADYSIAAKALASAKKPSAKKKSRSK